MHTVTRVSRFVTARYIILLFVLLSPLSTMYGCAREPFIDQQDIWAGGEGGYHTYRIPAIVVTGKGTVIAFCEGRKTGYGDHGDIDILMRRSHDDGVSWDSTTVVYEEGGTDDITIGNPCPIAEPRGGTVHLLFTRNNRQAFYMITHDEGDTWSKPLEITDIVKSFPFPVRRIGMGPGHGMIKRRNPAKGRLIAPVWINNRIGEVYRSGIIFSDDGGETWETGGLVPDDLGSLNECMVFEGEGGELGINCRSSSAKWRTISWSTDGGEHWSTPYHDKTLIGPTCQASIIAAPECGEDVVLFANPANQLARKTMTVRMSHDSGRTWPEKRLINPGLSGYSDLAIADDGAVLCLYESGENVRYDEMLTLARFSCSWITTQPDTTNTDDGSGAAE